MWTYIQLEENASATSYEPYTAGASPNPSYPQQIDTVTGSQTVLVTDASILDTTLEQGGIAGTTGQPSGSATNRVRTVNFSEVEPNTQYTIVSSTPSLMTKEYTYKADNTYIGTAENFTSLPYTFTTTSTTKYIKFAFKLLDDSDLAPADVTGLRMYSKSQSYTIDLGATELCKIGTYQDYIWKDGADWKVHKAIAKTVLDGTEDWVLLARDGHNNYYMENMAPNNLYIGSAATYMSNYYTGIPTDNRYADGTFFINTTGRGIFTYDAITTKDLFKTWLTTHNTSVYYVLATATDTVITDASLISQLDALASSTTYAPQTNYTTSTASPNLPVILTVDVFKNNYAGLLARLNKAGA